jgi:opacity protein-like surface antigen
MNKGRKHVIGLLAAVNVMGVFIAGNVIAAGGPPRFNNYGQVKLGIMQPTDDLDDAGYDTGGEISAAYGRYLTKNLVLEAAFDAFGTEHDIHGSNDIAGDFEQENDLGVAAFLLTMKGEFAVGPVNLYGGIGGGIYSATLDSDIDSSRLGSLSDDDSDTVFGGHLVAGATLDITQRFFLGVEGLYRWTDDLDLRDNVASVPIGYSGNLNGYAVTFNAGFRF